MLTYLHNMLTKKSLLSQLTGHKPRSLESESIVWPTWTPHPPLSWVFLARYTATLLTTEALQEGTLEGLGVRTAF